MIELAHYIRNGFVESIHYGSMAIFDGATFTALGDIDSEIFPRSATKPLQASAMVRLGLDLPERLLALTCASHSGGEMHRLAAKEILNSVGLDIDALQCPADRPYGDAERRAFGSQAPARDVHNCSGKHASMIATAVINGWDIQSYRDPLHPLQVEIKNEYLDASGAASSHVAVDGCGAPIFSMSLKGLAKASSSVSTGNTPARARVFAAMRAFPEMVGGEKRFTTEAMRLIPGLIVKEGAEGVEIAALADGRSVAFKVIDGSMRPIPAVLVAALSRMGVDVASLHELAKSAVLGGGLPVGEIVAAIS